ncbi:hypothetical protein ES703_12692 [subsurface metagenome]
MDWTGISLAEDLAKSKDQAQWLTWVQIPLGSVMFSRAPRADVLAARKSYTNPNFIIYEVKISRSDFNADVNKGKYLRYLDHCCQLYFAAPKGIITKDDIPEGTGLIIRGDSSWHVVKAATRREHNPDVELLLKLLMRGYEDQLVQWKQYDRIKNLEYKGLKEASIQFGIKVARDLGNASELIELANKIKDEVGKLLGKDYDSIWTAIYGLKADVDVLLTQRRYAPETIELVTIADRLLHGARFFANGTPKQLRAIADRLEEMFEAEKDKTAG